MTFRATPRSPMGRPWVARGLHIYYRGQRMGFYGAPVGLSWDSHGAPWGIRRNAQNILPEKCQQ